MSKINELGGYLIINLLILLKKYIIHRNKEMAFYFIKAENSTQAIKTLTPIQTELKEVVIGAQTWILYSTFIHKYVQKLSQKFHFKIKCHSMPSTLLFHSVSPTFLDGKGFEKDHLKKVWNNAVSYRKSGAGSH